MKKITNTTEEKIEVELFNHVYTLEPSGSIQLGVDVEDEWLSAISDHINSGRIEVSEVE